jgi:hypothetical protein
VADHHNLIARQEHTREVVAIVRKGSEESLPRLDAPRLARDNVVGGIDEHMIIAHQSA